MDDLVERFVLIEVARIVDNERLVIRRHGGISARPMSMPAGDALAIYFDCYTDMLRDEGFDMSGLLVNVVAFNLI